MSEKGLDLQINDMIEEFHLKCGTYPKDVIVKNRSTPITSIAMAIGGAVVPDESALISLMGIKIADAKWIRPNRVAIMKENDFDKLERMNQFDSREFYGLMKDAGMIEEMTL